MTKEELEKEAKVFATYYESLFPNDFETFYKAFLKVAEPREKRIAELEKQNKELHQKIIYLQNDKEDIIANWYCDKVGKCKIAELEAENTELKEKYVKNICDCDICDTYWNSKLTKAKELLNEFMRISKASDEDFEHDYSELIREAEQFLSEVEKCGQ